MNRKPGPQFLLLGSLVTVLLAEGCASTNCQFKATDASVDLARYETCYIADAVNADGAVVPTNIAALTGDRIASELRGRGTFATTLRQPPTDDREYLHVKTAYKNYQPGSRVARGILIGLGAADLRIDVQLMDGKSGRPLATSQVEEFWGWGGAMGMSRGIEEMQEAAFTHIGEGIDRACREHGRKQ